MLTIPVYRQQRYASKKGFTKSEERLNHLSWQPKQVYNKMTKGKYNIISPEFFSNQVDLYLKKIYQLLTLVMIEC